MHRFVVSGTHSTGKTTLIRGLTDALQQSGYKVWPIGEVARKVLAAGLPLDEEATTESYLMYLAEQLDALRTAPDDAIVISDRFLIDLLAYVETNANLDIPPDLVRVIELAAWLEAEQYSTVFYLPIEFPVVSDGVRNTDELYRAAVDRTLLRLLSRVGPPVVTLTGNIQERIRQATAVITTCLTKDQ
jgi:nicotinamide riboside kinase